MRVYKKNDIDFVDSKSGGLSLFNYRNPKFGTLWWKLPAKSKMPQGLHVSLDDGGSLGKNHFTIRPLYGMPVTQYLEKLNQLDSMAIPCFIGVPNKDVG